MKTLFDLVAPIAIYHGADLLYETQAMTAVDDLRKLARKGESALSEAVRTWGFKETEAMLEYRFTTHPDGLPNILDVYADLFRDICEDELPEAEWSRDRWGAWQLKDSAGNQVFSGDGSGKYPWYVDEQTLRDRLQEHDNEYA